MNFMSSERIESRMSAFRILVVLFSLVFAVSSFAAGKRFYRYVDDRGVKVIRDSVPPELVHRGYDVLGNDGRLLKTVPRALTKEEIAAMADSEKSKEAQAKEAAIQEAADKKLLTIFSEPKDAERARERKLEALDVLISVNRGNISRLEAEFDETRQLAAARERGGQEVPKHLVEKMDRLERQIQKLQATIQEKEAEKGLVREQYAKDIERLKYLMKLQGRL